MAKIKSAMEVALERAGRVTASSSSASELEGKRFESAGKVLAERYLKGELSVAGLREERGRFNGAQAVAVQSGIFHHLAEALSLDRAAAVAAAVKALSADEGLKRGASEVERLAASLGGERGKALKKLQATWNASQEKILARRGIKGSALAGSNVRRSPQWAELTAQAEEQFSQIVAAFKKQLTS